MGKKILLFFLLAVVIALPVFAYLPANTALAAGGALSVPPPGANTITFPVISVILLAVLNLIWMFFVFIAVVMFIIAGIHFLLAQGDPGKIQDAKKMVIWGIVGIFVAILAFSIVLTIGSFFPTTSWTGGGGGGSGTGGGGGTAATGACYWNGTCSIQTQAACLGATYGNKIYCGDNKTCADPC